MRQERTVQASIFDHYAQHEIGQELQAMSAWLDAHPALVGWVAADLRARPTQPTGRCGISYESVLRCAILKQYRQLTYEELSFCLLDSLSCQAFARLTTGWVPRKAALQSVISQISPTTWARINQHLLQQACACRVERGDMLRIDSTVTDAPIRAPSDSALLWDSVRVLVRLLERAQTLSGGAVTFCNHQRRAKKRLRAIQYTRGQDKKVRLYKDLIAVTDKTLQYAQQADLTLHAHRAVLSWDYAAWHAELAHFEPLIRRVIDQTERRVLAGEKVPAGDKIVSLFEEHTDIIVKGRRDVQYGHKLNLSTGRSGLVLDVVIEQGNPADAERLLPMLDRHIAQYGKPPRQMAADGGYASIANLDAAKARQVRDVVFHKKRGLAIEAMAKSPWVYRKLRNFRAGIEAGISCLKRAYGLRRCTWKGLAHFKAYVWSSVVAHNLALLARLKPIPT